MSGAQAVLAELKAIGDAADAVFLQRYFKTAPGDYGEGDRFLGIRVPVLRKLVRKYEPIDIDDCRTLLQSEWHEARLLALLILVRKYERGDAVLRAAIFELYLENTARINNWDLVDLSAPQIVGRHMEQRDRSRLLDLTRSESIWERRVAMLATFAFIKKGDFEDTFCIADMLLSDKHDLIHKAVGWMLREAANRDQASVEAWLKTRYARMPRTMLRYTIEKFDEPLRKRYLRGEV